MDVNLGAVILKDCCIDIKMEYRLGRRIEQGSEGDDIILEGRKSYEFVITGKIPMDKFHEIEGELAKGQPRFKSEFGEYKVAVKSLLFRASSGEFFMELVEDIV
jgi:hypothetical protein